MYIIKVILFIQNKNFVVKCIFEGGSIAFFIYVHFIYLGVIFGIRAILESEITHFKYFTALHAYILGQAILQNYHLILYNIILYVMKFQHPNAQNYSAAACLIKASNIFQKYVI